MIDDKEDIMLEEDNHFVTTSEQKRFMRLLRVQQQGGIITMVKQDSEEGINIKQARAFAKSKLEVFDLPQNKEDEKIEHNEPEKIPAQEMHVV